MLFLQGIAHMEGFYILNDRPQRNNNPGDLEWNTESNRFGATHGDPRFAIFSDVHTGWVALQRWLSVPAKIHQGAVRGYFLDPNGTTLVGGYLGATIAQVIHRFAPAGENDPALYVATVCKNCGLKPTDILTAELLRLPEAA